MDCDDEARGGVRAGDDRDLAVLNEVHILEAGIGVLGAEENFIMLLEPETPNVGVDLSFHLTFTEQCGLSASVS